MSETFNDARSSCNDQQQEKQMSLEESESVNLQRYARSTLYALRNSARSQRRPDCANRCELQALSFWKFSSGNGNGHESVSSSMGVGNASTDITNNVNSTGVVSGGQFSSSNRGRDRQINLRDRQIGYSRGMRISGVDAPFSHANAVASQKATFIDQRSNSIAHLMPAFAKKRIAAAAAQNQSPVDQISPDYQESRDSEILRNTNYEGSCRPVRGKELSYEHQRRGINDSVDYISPHRRSLNEHERDSGGGNIRHANTMYERRIGSGRLLPRDVNWEYHEKNSPGSQQRNSSRFTDRLGTSAGASSSYNEKNSFDRRNSGSNTGNEHFNSNNGSRRYNLDEHVRPQRHSFKERNDEPEWFSGGPTSQNDIIELRGFDEPIEENETDQSSENQKRARKLSAGDASNANLSQSSSNYDIPSSNQITNCETQSNIRETSIESPSSAFTGIGTNKDLIDLSDGMDGNDQTPIKADMSKEFNFDMIFNLDSLDSEIMHPGTNEMQKDNTSGGSRFSRWFANNNNLEKVPDEKSADLSKHSPKAANVLEFFQNAKMGSANAQKMEMPSVEELEAKMRKVDVQEKPIDVGTASMDRHYIINSENTQKNLPVSQDMEAFKKLLQQLNNGDMKNEILEHERVPHCVTPPRQALGMFPLMGMLPSEMSEIMPPMLPPITSAPPLPTNPDEMARANQIHQHRFPPMSPSQEMNRNTKPPYINESFVDQQKRRDFVNLLHAVTRGQIPLTFLEKELTNPNIPIPTKEVITAVIRETTRSITPSLNMLNNQAQLTPVHLMRGSPVNQQGIHSPTPMNVIQPSQIPGPSNQMLLQQTHPTEQVSPSSVPIGISNLQDTQIRSQALMQNVIMKKKSEEQQQDANRRQNEFQKQQSDNSHIQADLHSPQHQAHNQSSVPGFPGYPIRHLNSPTPLAFTPTSVLRKMTADKDTSPQMQQQSQQLHKLLPHMQHKSVNHGVFLNQNQQQQLPSAIPQPRMILGGNHTTTQMTTAQQPPHTQHVNQSISPQTLPSLLPNLQQQRVMPNEAKWQMNLLGQQGGMPLNKPMGRPILKGPTPSITMSIPQQTQQSMQILGHLHSTAPAAQQQNPQVPSLLFPAKLDMPQHRLKNNQTPQHMLNSQPSTQGLVSGQHMQQPVPQNVLHMQHQQMFQLHHMSLQQQQHMQLQRQLHQQMHTQPTVQSQQQQHENTNRLVNFPQSQPTVTNSTNNVSSTTTPSVCPREGGLSPTSNQLAQWFSPELLAQASAGKLPQINMNQALSLEEFERNIQQHSSTVVHN